MPRFCQGDSDEHIPNGPIAKTFENSVNNSTDAGSQERLIGFIFKVLAKGLVAAADLEVLKTKNTDKINKMSEEDFHVRYRDFYEHFSSNRVFTDKYGFHDNMTKAEAIEFIRIMDKDKICVIIDALPDVFIANEFKRHLFKNKQAVPASDNKNVFGDRMNEMIAEVKDKYL